LSHDAEAFVECLFFFFGGWFSAGVTVVGAAVSVGVEFAEDVVFGG